MKTKIGLLLIAGVTASLFAKEVEIQAVVGKNKVDCDTKYNYDDSNTLGVRNNIFLSKNNALQLAYDRLKDVDGTKDFHRYSVNYLATQRDNASKVHPFALIGIGYEDGSDEDQGFANAGLGATVELGNSISLVGEVKAIRKNVTKDVDINTNIGLGVMIGCEADNTPVEDDCLAETVAPKLVQNKIFVQEEPIMVDEKVNCVR